MEVWRDAVRADKRNNVLARPRSGCAAATTTKRGKQDEMKEKRSNEANVKKGGEGEVCLYRMLGVLTLFSHPWYSFQGQEKHFDRL